MKQNEAYRDREYVIENHGEGWFFWDETWTDMIGPYSSETEASARLEEYLEHINS